MEAKIDVPHDWNALAEALRGAAAHRLIVLGGADMGKSTFCRFLLSRIPEAQLIDTDLGQKIVGPPACVTLGQTATDGTLRLIRQYFVGDVSPSALMPGVVAGLARLTASSEGRSS